MRKRYISFGKRQHLHANCYCFNISLQVFASASASASDNYPLSILSSLHCVTSAFVVLIVSSHLGARERFSMPSKTCPPNLSLPTSDIGGWWQFRDQALTSDLSLLLLSDVVKKVVEGHVGNLRYFSLPRLRQIVTQWSLEIVGLLHIWWLAGTTFNIGWPRKQPSRCFKQFLWGLNCDQILAGPFF